MVLNETEVLTHEGGTAIVPVLPAEVVECAVSKPAYEADVFSVPIAPGQPTWWGCTCTPSRRPLCLRPSSHRPVSQSVGIQRPSPVNWRKCLGES